MMTPRILTPPNGKCPRPCPNPRGDAQKLHGSTWRGNARIAITLFLTVILLAACQSDGQPVFDKTMPPDRRIPLLEGGPHAGTADTGELVVDYAYTRQPSSSNEVTLHVQGSIVGMRRGSLIANVYLMALESDGKVILRRALYSSGFKTRSSYFRPTWTFDKTVTLPPETSALAIDSYTRLARGRR